MKTFKSIAEIRDIHHSVIALGNFDGIHKGHQEIINRTVKSARVAGLKSAVFTFSNHTRNMIGGKPPVKNILKPEEKAAMIQSMGIDYLFSLPFDREMRDMLPIPFIHDLLLETCRMREVYCGFNFHFGRKAAGTPQTLMEESLKWDFGLHVLEPYKIDDCLVSSSLIRTLIEEGELEQCAKYLGRRYTIGGEVVVGHKLGRTIGFPTSNLLLDESMATPANGVYITYCTYNDQCYPSVTNVGIKPTVGACNKNVETHIFNFDKELYGKQIRVEFIKKIRDEEKFQSVEALSRQITQDCLTAKSYHRSKGTQV